MKITKSQKEAIVHEISRRIEKEHQTFKESFNKNYKFTKEEKEFIDLCEETEKMAEKFNHLKTKNINFALRFGYNTFNFVTSSDAKNYILNDRMKKVYSPKSINPSEIRDRLELATLDPSFDVEEFIKKFI